LTIAIPLLDRALRSDASELAQLPAFCPDVAADVHTVI
jgi:hypothetical protein